jgi:hypothetical protein
MQTFLGSTEKSRLTVYDPHDERGYNGTFVHYPVFYFSTQTAVEGRTLVAGVLFLELSRSYVGRDRCAYILYVQKKIVLYSEEIAGTWYLLACLFRSGELVHSKVKFELLLF